MPKSIASMLIGQELQIGHDPTHHVAYLQSWVKLLEDEPKTIIEAVKDADKISKYVLDWGREKVIETETLAETVQTQTQSDKEPLITTENTPINVPYKEKNEAKALGAKWDKANSTWYVPKGVDLNKFDRWRDEQKLSQEVLRPQDTAYLQTIGKNFDGAKTERTAKSFDEVREIAKEFVGKDLICRHDGVVATISRNSLDKMLSGKAHEKSVNVHTHLIAAANIDKLFENSVFGWQTKHKNNDVNMNAIHRAIAPLRIGDEVYLAKLTVQEFARDGNRIYSVEAIEIDNEKSPIPEMVANDLQYEAKTDRLNRALIDIIVKNAQEYNRQQEKNQNLSTPKTYLYVPYEDKDAAAKLGAKWDKENMAWYAPAGSDLDKFKAWQNPPYVPSAEAALKEHLEAQGITVGAGHPIFDDRPHRLSNDGSQDKNVMYHAYANQGGVPFARITNFSRGNAPEEWKYPKEHLEVLKMIDRVNQANGITAAAEAQNPQSTIKPSTIIDSKTTQKVQEVDKIKKAQADLTAQHCKTLMTVCPIAPANQNYLARKQVTANDVVRIIPDSSKLPKELEPYIAIANTPKQATYMREHNPDNKLILQRGNLAIPQYNTDGELRAFETVAYNGAKYALKGADKQGLMTKMGAIENGKPIIISEGYATGATLHEHTKADKPTVVVAFGKGGLLNVAEQLRQKYPDSRIYIAADNDHQKQHEINPQTGKTKGNAGLVNAKQVTDKISNAYVLVPSFEPNDKGKDWNDVYVDKGIDEFKRQIKAQLSNIQTSQITTDKIVAQTPQQTKIAVLDKNQLDPVVLKAAYPNMSDKTIASVQKWRENLPIRYANSPQKAEAALTRLAESLPNYANGEQLPPPKTETEVTTPNQAQAPQGYNR
ncbi:MAG: DUF5710 domain-containing protein [Moraxella sp.]|nr:DUF5710 domain-containing protein [Moraxella sp.]